MADEAQHEGETALSGEAAAQSSAETDLSGQGKVERATLGRITIRVQLELQTGTRIGGPQDTIEIGGIDNLIVRDPLTGEPYLPGSALKGKMRSILEKGLVALVEPGRPPVTFNRAMPGGKRHLMLYRHECCCAVLAVQCPVCRLFGASGNDEEHKHHDPEDTKPATNFPAKLLVRDAFLTHESRERLQELTTELPYAEWKAENTLDRITSAAVPRQMERAARGSCYEFTMVYRIETIENQNGQAALDPEVITDLYNLLTVLSQLEDEGIGGSVSRGYGAVSISNVEFTFAQKTLERVGDGPVCRIRKTDVPDLHLVGHDIIKLQQSLVQASYELKFNQTYDRHANTAPDENFPDTVLQTPPPQELSHEDAQSTPDSTTAEGHC